MQNDRLIILFYFIFILFPGLAAKGKSGGENYTVIVSLDGFRYDYCEMYSTPRLDKIASDGVKAVMLPSFPSSTFPNHYAMATGLVPNNNGIVNNTFWDKENNCQFSMGDSAIRNNPSYYLGEPIWLTAQKQGLNTANFYWVGSDIAIKGAYPTYYYRWADKPRLSFEERIDSAVSMLSKAGKSRSRLIMLYFEEPDWTGHFFGPKSSQAQTTVQKMDSLIGVLKDKIDALSFGNSVNLIVTSDHGMTEISDTRVVRMSQYIKKEWCEAIDGTTPTSLFTKPQYRDSVYSALKDVPFIDVYRKEDVPIYLEYGSSERVGDIIVIPHLGWQFTDFPRKLKGAHGYYPQHSDMQVLFRACGPDFKEGYEKKERFVNVDIYPLLAYLLQIDPEKNDGKFERVEDLLIISSK